MGQPLSISPSLSGVWESTQPWLHCCPQTKDHTARFLTHQARLAPPVDTSVSEYSGVPQADFPYLSLDPHTPQFLSCSEEWSVSWLTR